MARVQVVRERDTEYDFVRCRTYNHAWDEFFPIDMERPWYGWRLSLRCVRCHTERHDIYDYNQQLSQRRYIYPDGYQTPKGEEKPDRAVFREELFSRLREKLEESHSIGEEGRPTPAPVPIKAARRARKSA